MLLIYVKLHMMFVTKGQSETTSLLVLSLARSKVVYIQPPPPPQVGATWGNGVLLLYSRNC